MTYVHKTMNSPVGRLTLIGSAKGLAAVLWENDNPERVRARSLKADTRNRILLEAEHQLNEYFSGARTEFSLPLDMHGTEFQIKVWKSLLAIPFGETRSYSELARRIGKPNAVRAVGAAIGRNPLSIVVPCHRVIGSSGQLTGFAGGLKTKAELLRLEGVETLGAQQVLMPFEAL